MLFADVAELADALDLGSSVTDVGVQVPSSAPKIYKPYKYLNVKYLCGFLMFL